MAKKEITKVSMNLPNSLIKDMEVIGEEELIPTRQGQNIFLVKKGIKAYNKENKK